MLCGVHADEVEPADGLVMAANCSAIRTRGALSSPLNPPRNWSGRRAQGTLPTWSRRSRIRPWTCGVRPRPAVRHLMDLRCGPVHRGSEGFGRRHRL